MKKFVLVSCVLAVFFIQNIAGQELGELYREREFTMSMPSGWQTVDVGLGYLQINGPQSGAFAPSISFRDEAYSGPVSDYIDMISISYQRVISNFRSLGRSTFRTNVGVAGEQITIQGSMGTGNVRQRIYFIPNRRGNAVMVVTCTVPITDGERYDTLFDAAVRTFNWTR